MDLLIPIVFPDYRILVDVPKTKVDVLPGVAFDNFTIPQYHEKVSNLGHAGVLFVSGQSGTTKYYEYGRYDSRHLGLVVKARNLPDARSRNGNIEPASLKNALSFISRISGQSGRVSGVYVQVANKYGAMLSYAESRKAQNSNPGRKPYDLLSNSCIHFVKEVAASAGVATPWMADPRPNSYIGEFRNDFPDLDYAKGVLTIEGLGKF